MSFKRVDTEQTKTTGRLPDDRFVFVHPEEVADNPILTPSEKRALLASWASDQHAVEGAPQLRQLDSGAIVPLDAILSALRALDEPAAPQSPSAWRPRPRRLRLRQLRRRTMSRLLRRPDDDPPPPPKPARVRLSAA